MTLLEISVEPVGLCDIFNNVEFPGLAPNERLVCERNKPIMPVGANVHSHASCKMQITPVLPHLTMMTCEFY